MTVYAKVMCFYKFLAQWRTLGIKSLSFTYGWCLVSLLLQINLRPSGNMMLKPQGPRFLPPSAMSNTPSSSPPRGIAPIQSLLPQNPAAMAQQPSPLQAGYPGLPVKQVSSSGGGGSGGTEKKQEKKKQPTKEELLKSVVSLMEE